MEFLKKCHYLKGTDGILRYTMVYQNGHLRRKLGISKPNNFLLPQETKNVGLPLPMELNLGVQTLSKVE